MENSFLRQTARAIIEKMDWKRLASTTLVLPSHRAGLVLKDELLRLQQEYNAQAIWAPTVQTLTQLQDDLSPLYPEDELFTIIRLYKLYLSTYNVQPSAKPMSLDLFYGWGRQMIADFTNVDASMPIEEVPNFFENTIAAHELEQWQLDKETEERLRQLMGNERLTGRGEKDSIRAQYEQLWQQIYALYKALRAQMTAEQKGYPGLRQRAVIEHWEDDTIQTKIAGRTYIFVGFNYLLPVERDLMMRLRDANQALFFWDFVPDFRTNEKAFSFAKLNSELLGIQNTEYRAQAEFPKQVTVMACPSRESQAQFVHRWLRENYTAHGQKVGIVICEETMLEPVIYTLPAITLPGEDAIQPINITKGFPLRNTMVYSRAMAWLNDTARGKATDLVRPEIIEQLLSDLFPVSDTTSPETDASSSFTWQELLILESEYQVRKIANQMRLLITSGLGDVPFTLKLLRLLMRRTMETVTMPFHGEPVTDIQVMGVLETRLLDFDKLLILNVEEGVVPQRQSDNSFIPFYLRKAYHMQTPDERATVYAYNFFRLLSRTGQATLLYATAETAEGGKGMSRFIMQLIYSDEFDVKRCVLQESSAVTLASAFCISQSGRSLLSMLTKDGKGVLRREDGSCYRLSPSALNTYITCPRAFYLQYIEGIQPVEEEEVLFAPNTMGSFVHYAMQFIYKQYFHSENEKQVVISSDEIEAIRTDEDKIQAALDAAYVAMEKYVPEHHRGENVIIKGYINNILERDREDAKAGLQMYLLEKDCTFPIMIESAGIIRVGGKIDRLDIYGDKEHRTLRVVDYKSGSYNDTTHAKRMSSNWEELMVDEEKSYVRQTMLYSHAVLVHDRTELPIEPHLFFCRRKLTDIETTIHIDNQPVHDYRTVQSLFINALQTKIKEVLTTTVFEPCAPDQCPSYCPFFRLCGRKPKEI